MNRNKIDYGIDLGTTNSAISRMDDGEITIIQGDDTSSSTIPSCVAFNPKGTIFVGPKALNFFNKEVKSAFKSRQKGNLNSFLEFKRTMGHDNKYESDNAEKSFSSEDLSAEVLKKLRGYVRDEEVNVAVITVPARFIQSQLDATQRAAELAGFQYCELLQEPIAASMAYGLDSNNASGKWLVFDFGGGTFDVALIKVDEGIMKVVDTSGDNHLGGKNLNDLLIDEVFIPYLRSEYNLEQSLSDSKIKNLLRQALKELAEQTKIELATKEKAEIYADATMYELGEDDDGEEIIIDITLALKEFEKVVNPLLQRSIDLANELLEANNLTGSDLQKILPVGGTTYLQSLQRMISEQISDKLDLSQNPMTAVTKGASLFASTKDVPDNIRSRDNSKIQLDLKYPETTVEQEEKIGIRISRDNTEGQIPKALYVEVLRKDDAWSSGRVEVEDDAIILDVLLQESKPNGFEILLSDDKGTSLPTEPSSFTIINGMKSANATLPFAICIDAYQNEKEASLLEPLIGLGKNQSLPAKGKQTFKILKDLRPGNAEDTVNIEVYEGEPGTKKEYNTFVRNNRIYGTEIPEFIPKGSEVEITIEIDSSRRIALLSAYFPYIDETVETEKQEIESEEPEVSELEVMINKAKQKLRANKNNYSSLDTQKVEKLESRIQRLTNLLENGKEDVDAKFEVLSNIREISIELDKLEEQAEWPQIEVELKECLKNLKLNQQQYGNSETQQIVQELETNSNEVIKSKNSKRAQDLIEEVRSLEFQLIGQDIGFWVALLKNFDDEFDMHDWKNRNEAKQLINSAKQVLSTQPSLDKIRNIVLKLFTLLPNSEQPPIPTGPDSDLAK
ncbi:MAG: Hsp70 family protein [Candidatus Paceibacterota bacterium]